MYIVPASDLVSAAFSLECQDSKSCTRQARRRQRPLPAPSRPLARFADGGRRGRRPQPGPPTSARRGPLPASSHSPCRPSRPSSPHRPPAAARAVVRVAHRRLPPPAAPAQGPGVQLREVRTVVSSQGCMVKERKKERPTPVSRRPLGGHSSTRSTDGCPGGNGKAGARAGRAALRAVGLGPGLPNRTHAVHMNPPPFACTELTL